MRLLSLIGMGSFVAVSLWVGGRLLGLARRTREMPEAAIGTALFFGAGLGFLLVIGSRQVPLPPEWIGPVRQAGAFFLHVGPAALAFGSWRIFRPAGRWARAACLAIIAALSASLSLRLFDPSGTTQPASTPLHFWPMSTLGAVSYGWCAVESARYAAMLRRRARLGLADPALAQRFALWAAGGACAVGVHLCSMANRFVVPTVMHPAILVVSSSLGFVAAVTIWLAFFPPAWWMSRTAPGAA